MRPIKDTYGCGKPVIAILDLGDGIVGMLDTSTKAADRIVIRRYGPHAVSQVRKYLQREWPDHVIAG